MESNEITKGAILITYLSCIRILGGVMEVLLFQPGFLLIRLRDVDALDLKDDRPRTALSLGTGSEANQRYRHQKQCLFHFSMECFVRGTGLCQDLSI